MSYKIPFRYDTDLPDTNISLFFSSIDDTFVNNILTNRSYRKIIPNDKFYYS